MVCIRFARLPISPDWRFFKHHKFVQSSPYELMKVWRYGLVMRIISFLGPCRPLFWNVFVGFFLIFWVKCCDLYQHFLQSWLFTTHYNADQFLFVGSQSVELTRVNLCIARWELTSIYLSTTTCANAREKSFAEEAEESLRKYPCIQVEEATTARLTIADPGSTI